MKLLDLQPALQADDLAHHRNYLKREVLGNDRPSIRLPLLAGHRFRRTRLNAAHKRNVMFRLLAAQKAAGSNPPNNHRSNSLPLLQLGLSPGIPDRRYASPCQRPPLARLTRREVTVVAIAGKVPAAEQFARPATAERFPVPAQRRTRGELVHAEATLDGLRPGEAAQRAAGRRFGGVVHGLNGANLLRGGAVRVVVRNLNLFGEIRFFCI
uniref:(northern house mosquito) hypothetical protein n=1 Tax=Culex pipiens TaxID=7175 RepID=A0A8D8HVM1_CULPI